MKVHFGTVAIVHTVFIICMRLLHMSLEKPACYVWASL